MSKSLRTDMPTVATWIDDLRSVFGAECINTAIKSGIAGQPTFYASENGIIVGTRAPLAPEKTISLTDVHIGPFNAPAAQHSSRVKGK